MRSHCPRCYSPSLHLSSFRKSDAVHLLRLMYPVRCLDCYRRGYVLFPIALKLQAQRVTKPQRV